MAGFKAASQGAFALEERQLAASSLQSCSHSQFLSNMLGLPWERLGGSFALPRLERRLSK